MGKGEDWERETAKLLSLWWSGGETDDLIWRTSGSGSRATTRRRTCGLNTQNASGDLCYTDPIVKPLFDFMTFECKRGYTTKKDKKLGKRVPMSPSETINVLYWLDRPTNTKPPLLYRWWHELSHDRRLRGSHWQAIIFRRTGKRKTIMFECGLFNQFNQWCNSYTQMSIIISMPHKAHPWPEEEYILLDLEHFLNWVSPQTIIEILEEYGGPLEPKIQKRKLR